MKPNVAPNPNATAATCKLPIYNAIDDNRYDVNLNTPYIENSLCCFNRSFLVMTTPLFFRSYFYLFVFLNVYHTTKGSIVF